MSHCPNCGAEILAGARFCTYCGTQVAAAAVTAVPTVAQTIASDYSVMLVSCGSCMESEAAELIEDLCGYSAADAREVVRSAPIAFVHDLTAEQAGCLAQALAEYGMEVSIYDGTGYRTVTNPYDTVYDTNGNLLAAVAGILGMIGRANRLTRAAIRRHDYPFAFAGKLPPMYAPYKGPRRSMPRRQGFRRPDDVPPAPVHGAPMPAPRMQQPARQPRNDMQRGPMGMPQSRPSEGPRGGMGQGPSRGSNRGSGGPNRGPGGPGGSNRGPGGHR